jgi:hypothetical protein
MRAVADFRRSGSGANSRHQAVDRAAGDAVVQLRVPLAGLQHFGVPDFRLQLVAQDRRVHLVLAAQLGHLDLVQLAQQRLVGGHGLLLAGGAQVVQLAVVAVVTDLGGADRRQLHPGVQGALGQVGEGGIDRRVTGLLAGGRGGSVGRGVGRLATGQGGDQGEGKKMRAHRRSCTGSNPSIGPGLLCPRAIGLPWAQTRTLQRSAGHGIPGKLPLRQDRIHRTGRGADQRRHRLQLLDVPPPRQPAVVRPARGVPAGTDPADVATYHFNKAHIDHHHCRECGIAPYSEAVDPRTGTPMVAVNVRCVPQVDLAGLSVTSYNGAAL